MGLLENLKRVLIGEKVDYNALIQAGAIIVDVRTKQEFQSGNLKESRNIPLQNLHTHFKELNGKVVILVCRSGARAEQAKNSLNKQGINAHNAGAWQNLR